MIFVEFIEREDRGNPMHSGASELSRGISKQGGNSKFATSCRERHGIYIKEERGMGGINGWTNASGDEVERWGIRRINVVMRYPKRGIDGEERQG